MTKLVFNLSVDERAMDHVLRIASLVITELRVVKAEVAAARADVAQLRTQVQLLTDREIDRTWPPVPSPADADEAWRADEPGPQPTGAPGSPAGW